MKNIYVSIKKHVINKDTYIDRENMIVTIDTVNFSKVFIFLSMYLSINLILNQSISLSIYRLLIQY
jgi:hypothetical protein